ncbi:DUF58 domain-containing protein [Niveibacterium sp. 24ML]|uniref:DUF58 domain-containing protein n=1 Tax=Niveibacterium sp. 24ML TaxID=2985512 RepID=UPI0022721D3F|nr:DUF58 domain-containing protein [Niveibacterium sp. 24ML]MCX9156059.1 DUF58 domain-containing protein [Niveibacterium sp. 24ML]
MISGIKKTMQARAQRWMLRGRSAEALPVTLGQRRIYVLPTAAGLSFGAMLLAMLIASLNYNLALGFAMTFVLAGVGHLAMVRAHRNLLGISLTSGRCENAYAGDARTALLGLSDTKNRPRFALAIGALDGPAIELSIAAQSETSVTITLPERKRGAHPVGRLRLETCYPLGLVVAWSYLEPDLLGLVYPAPEVDPPAPALSEGDGEGLSMKSGEGSSFDSLRPYRAGDPPRRIAWRQLARGGPMATKHFESEVGGERWLDWDACPSTMGTEARLSRLCAWALQAEQSGLDWGLRLPRKTLGPARGPAHLNDALRALALHGGDRT